MSSPKSSSAALRPLPKKPLLLRRVAAEWSQFFDRVRAAHDDSLDELVIDELFDSSDHPDLLLRLMRPNRGYSATEEAFLEKYRQYKLLDKMALAMALPSSNPSLPPPPPPPPPSSSATAPAAPALAVDTALAADTGLATEVNSFRDVDVCKMRLDAMKDLALSDGTVDDSSLGSRLWRYRRAKWLEPTPAGSQRHLAPPLAPAPKEQYVKIYTQLVDKGRPLKHGLNLGDVVTVINAGWVAEERWDRAAKGLP